MTATLSEQLDLASEAWRYEQRGAHGEWVKGLEDVMGPDSPAVKHLASISEADIAAGISKKPSRGIQGDTKIVTLPSGERIIDKTLKDFDTGARFGNTIIPGKDMADAEELSYYVSQAIGAGAPAIQRRGDNRVIEQAIHGMTGAEYATKMRGQYFREEQAKDPDRADEESDNRASAALDRIIQTPQGALIGVLDYLTSQQDRRNPGNYMVVTGAKPVPIDQSSSAFDGGDPISEFTDDNEIWYKTWPVDKWRPRLQALEPQFQRMGRQQQFNNMMSRFAHLKSDTAQLSITDQAVELAIWQHEPRNDHGEWTTDPLGNPATAKHVITYVPGVGSDKPELRHGEIERAIRIKMIADQMAHGESTAVAVFGYASPDSIPAGLEHGPGLAAAKKLANFQRKLMAANPYAHFTVVGHSYGSFVAGQAAKLHGMKPDDLVFIGSPGTGVRHASELGMPEGHVWAGAEQKDIIPRLATLISPDLKGNPALPGFGANVFEANATPQLEGLGRLHPEAHGSYFLQGSKALPNIGAITTGHYGRVRKPAIAASNITDQALELAGWTDAWLHEARGPNGEWIKSGESGVLQLPERSYSVPPHERLINARSPYHEPADHPFFRKYPVSHVNIEHAWTLASPGQVEQGMRWYPDAGLISAAMAHGDGHLGAGLLSAFSPQTSWPVNMFNAARSVELGRPIRPHEGTTVMQQQTNAAQKIMDGIPFDTALPGPKTNAFAHLIENLGLDDPNDPYGKVVVDRHAVSVAAGQRVSDMEEPPIGDDRYYQLIADEYRKAAINISKKLGRMVTPSQVQAVTWLVQQAANEAEDAALAQQGKLDPAKSRLAKGRVTRTRNAWAAWMKYAGQHDLQVAHGTTALSMLTDTPVMELAAWEHELRDAHGRWTKSLVRPITADELHPGAKIPGKDGASRAVSAEEFQRIAGQGLRRLAAISKTGSGPTTGLDRNWDVIKAKTFVEVQQPWGGATIDAHTGSPADGLDPAEYNSTNRRSLPNYDVIKMIAAGTAGPRLPGSLTPAQAQNWLDYLNGDTDRFALSVKPQGMDTISIPEGASEDEFSAAMDRARATFGPELQKGSRALGIFHDDDNHRIDIDPVLVVHNRDDVESIGAYTHAIGGAYHFQSGDGYWPPHVEPQEHSWPSSRDQDSGALPLLLSSQISLPSSSPRSTQPLTITAQTTELSWKDAWTHELRGPHGEWIKSPGQADEFSSRVEDRILRSRDAETDPQTKGALSRALRAFAGHGSGDEAAKWIANAASRQHALGNEDKSQELYALAQSAKAHPYNKMDTDAIGKQLVDLWTGENEPVARNHLNRASAAFDAGDYSGAIDQLQKAAAIAKVTPGNHNAFAYLSLASQIRSSTAVQDATKKAITDITLKAAPLVPDMLGGGKSSFTGKVSLFSEEERATDTFTLWGETDWKGNISFSDGTASIINDLVSTKNMVTKPDQTTVPLHELIHTVGQTSDDALPYQKIPAVQAAEEGFTQLGTAMHAADFFRKMGVGNRQTEVLASGPNGGPVPDPAWRRKVAAIAADMQKEFVQLDKNPEAYHQQVARHLGELVENLKADPENLLDITTDDQFSGALSEIQHLGDTEAASWAMGMKQRVHQLQGEPMDKHATLAEYAERLADPQRIAEETSWDIYPWQTRIAQQWVTDVAAHETARATPGKGIDRKRLVELADEINRVGDKNKFITMARQLLRAEDIPVQETPGVGPGATAGDLTKIEKILMDNWVGRSMAGDDPDEAALRQTTDGGAYAAALGWMREAGLID